MTDITEQLEKLASLRDRGVLTQEEFDTQKAMLLNAPASPAPAPVQAPYAPATQYAPTPVSHGSRGGLPVWAFVAGAALLLIAAGVALWGTGALSQFGIKGWSGGSSGDTVAFTPMPTPTNSFTTPMATPMPTAAPTFAPSYPSNDGGMVANPLVGSSWQVDGTPTSRCPPQIAFAATSLTISGTLNGQPESKTVGMSYEVRDAGTVVLKPVTGGNSATASLSGGTLTLDGCSYHRSY